MFECVWGIGKEQEARFDLLCPYRHPGFSTLCTQLSSCGSEGRLPEELNMILMEFPWRWQVLDQVLEPLHGDNSAFVPETRAFPREGAEESLRARCTWMDHTDEPPQAQVPSVLPCGSRRVSLRFRALTSSSVKWINNSTYFLEATKRIWV